MRWGGAEESDRKAAALAALLEQLADGDLEPAATIDVSTPDGRRPPLTARASPLTVAGCLRACADGAATLDRHARSATRPTRNISFPEFPDPGTGLDPGMRRFRGGSSHLVVLM